MESPSRDAHGRLLPGHTANPNGRPKRKTFREFFTEEEEQDFINKLKTSDKPEIWMKIAEQLFGKPRQLVGLEGSEEGQPVVFSIAKELVEKNGISLASSAETDSE